MKVKLKENDKEGVIENEQDTKDFNIYYLNFSKVYEIAMMIDNVIRTKIERDFTKSKENQDYINSSIGIQGNKLFLNGIKSNISSESKEINFMSTKVVESLEIKTTKSILLRRIINLCSKNKNFEECNEGDLIKVDNVKLELLDEDSLRQFLILRRDAFKGMQIEGLELSNLVGSMLQDYSYILKGIIDKEDSGGNHNFREILIKIPLEMQTEFENKYSINDLLIGHVSIVGIFKGIISKEKAISNTFTYLQGYEDKKKDNAKTQTSENRSRIIKSSQFETKDTDKPNEENFYFIDVIAIIQDVIFKFNERDVPKMHWWNKIGLWLSNKWR